MRRMTSPARSRGLVRSLVAALIALPLGCGGGGATGPGAATSPGGGSEGAAASLRAECGGVKRSAPECSSPVDAKGFAAESDATKSQEKAIQRINDELKSLSAEQARVCEAYLGCSIDDAAFKRDMGLIKDRIASLPSLVDAMRSAKTYGEKKRALDGLYRGVVPDNKRVEELTFRMGMTAELPGGDLIDVQPGTTLPTNTRSAFTFEVSREAYLYIFQKSPTGEVNVLFPNALIATKNPLPAGQEAQIPPKGQRFRLNDKDLGMENVYIVASLAPVQSLDGALEKVKQGKVTMISEDSMLRGFTQVVPGTAPSGCKTRAFELEPSPEPASGQACTRTRGLVLDPPPAQDAPRSAPAGGRVAQPSEGSAPMPSAGTQTSMTGRAVLEVRTDPGDNMIVKIFPFKHVTEAEFKSGSKPAAGGSSEAMKTRSIVVEF